MKCSKVFWRVNRRGLGFSLIELLVVISIIALLIALLMPTLGKTRQAARTSVCLAYKRQIAIALTAYAIDHHGRLMPLSSYSDFSGRPTWYQALSLYALETNLEVGTSILRCPTYDPIQPAAHDRGYAVNYPGVFAHSDPPPGFGNSTLYQGSAVLDKVPGQVFLSTDFKTTGSYATDPSAAWVSFLYNPNYPGGQFVLNVDTDGDGVSDSASTQLGGIGVHNGVDPRHPNRTVNFSFADGSARSLTLNQWATNENGLWGDAGRLYK